MKRKIFILAIAMSCTLMLSAIGSSQSTSPPADSATQAAAYAIPWQSVNSGGTPAASTNYRLNGSAGQSAIGFVTSTNYQHGIGYWYGAGGAACDCGVWGDVSGDGANNPVDVVKIVNFVYKSNDTRVQPPNCPEQAGDANCSGTVNPVDVVLYVNRVYKSNSAGWCPDPCGP